VGALHRTTADRSRPALSEARTAAPFQSAPALASCEPGSAGAINACAGARFVITHSDVSYGKRGRLEYESFPRLNYERGVVGP